MTNDALRQKAYAKRATFRRKARGAAVDDVVLGNTTGRAKSWWSAVEVEFLRQNHGRVPQQEICGRLQRSDRAVRNGLRQHGITHPLDSGEYWGASEIGKAFGVNRNTATDWLTYHAIRPDFKKDVPLTANRKRNSGGGVYQYVRMRKGLAVDADPALPVVFLWSGNLLRRVVHRQSFLTWLTNPLNHWFLRRVEGRICDTAVARAIRYGQRQWDDRWVTVQEAAQGLGYTSETVRVWLTQGLCPSAIYCGYWVVRFSEVERVSNLLAEGVKLAQIAQEVGRA